MAENSIKSIMDVTMEKIRAMVDADTVIGDPIQVDGVTLIPVSKVSFGLATGGSDFPSKTTNSAMFGGGGGAGVSITPVAFLAVCDGNVKMLQIYKQNSPADKALALLPDLFDRICGLFKKNKEQDVLPTVIEE